MNWISRISCGVAKAGCPLSGAPVFGGVWPRAIGMQHDKANEKNNALVIMFIDFPRLPGAAVT